MQDVTVTVPLPDGAAAWVREHPEAVAAALADAAERARWTPERSAAWRAYCRRRITRQRTPEDLAAMAAARARTDEITDAYLAEQGTAAA